MRRVLLILAALALLAVAGGGAAALLWPRSHSARPHAPVRSAEAAPNAEAGPPSRHGGKTAEDAGTAGKGPPKEGGTPAKDAAGNPITDPCPKGCINFVINVHDWSHPSESADTLIHYIDIFEKHKVKGEFYFTAPIVEAYMAERPDVIARLKSSGMTISYHIRPPHPLYYDFDARLKAMDDATLAETLRDYETYRLDLSTGELDRSKSGGYTLVKQVFGSAPVTVVAPNSDRRLRVAAFSVYKELGAKAALWYHEEGTTIETPLEVRGGLLVRPSDFSITRWDPPGQAPENFWWNGSGRDDPDRDPTLYLQKRLADWHASRGPLITSLIHENNMPRAGAELWTYAYYTDEKKSGVLPPPWNIHPNDVTKRRSPAEQAAIWADYDALVAWSAKNLRVVTMTDYVGMVGL